MSTNYVNTFITASADTMATKGTEPTRAGSIAQIQYSLLAAKPYHYTSDDLLFEVHAIRKGIARKDRPQARAAFFARSQACLRASPLVKQFGWGLHHDGNARVAAYGVETADYRELSKRAGVKVVPGMRSSRAR
jgi:hypothetical protein